MDGRRDAMKWLVQKLDSLSTHMPKEDGQYEQQKLESLVSRYKVLVPSIETAINKADINAKCYLYRDDINTVIETLNEVKRHCDRTTTPDTLEIVHQLIKEQDVLVKQLEEQRDNIFETLQRGKDLSKDPIAPLFVSGLVQTLEAKWAEAYNGSVEKLNKLKNTYKIWTDYVEQKNDIQKLLTQAEAELAQIIQKSNPQQVANELNNKQEMNEHLSEASDQMLRKLNNLSSNLATLSKPEKKLLLEKEVVDIEERMKCVIDTVANKIEFLEQLNQKWVSFTGTLQELKKWGANAQHVLERLVTLEMSPDERALQTGQLQTNLKEKMAIVMTLEEEGVELLDGEPSPEALQFESDLKTLKGAITTLNQHTIKHVETVQKELKYWNEYQVQVQVIKPWIEEAEMKVSDGMIKPKNLQEAIQQSKNTKEFENECSEYLGKLRGVTSQSAQVTRLGSVTDEVDALHSRWAAIHDVAIQWSERTESLVAEWEDFNYKCDAVTSFIHQIEERLESVSEYAPKILSLDDRIENLKDMSKELTDTQSSMITLSATSDHIAAALANEGVSSIKTSVTELKVMVSKLSEDVMKLKNELADVVILKDEYRCKLNSLESWLNRFSNNLGDLEDIDVDDLDNLPDMLHSMQQEHDDRQEQVTRLAEECRDVGEKCTGRDRDSFYQMFDDNEARYENYGSVIQSKKPVFLKWKEFWEWKINTTDNLQSVKQQLENKPNIEELNQISKELISLRDQCRAWDDESHNVSEQCKRSSTTIRDPDTGNTLDIEEQVEEVKKKLDTVEKTLDSNRQQLQTMNTQWESFNRVKNQVNEFLTSLTMKVSNKDSSINNYAAVLRQLENIESALKDMQTQSKNKEKLHDLGRSLMASDSTQLVSVQNALTAADGSWDRTQSMLYELQTKFTSITSLWKQCNELREELNESISDAKQVTPQLERPASDICSVQSMVNISKKSTDNLKKTRQQLENFMSKIQHLCQQLEGVEGYDTSSVKSMSHETQSKWQTTIDFLNQRGQSLEGQHVLWKQINQGRDEIYMWLNETCESLDDRKLLDEADKASEKLEKYKSELPTYESSFKTLKCRIEQLESMNGGKSIVNANSIISTLTTEFDQTHSASSKLESYLEEMRDQENSIYDEIKDTSETLIQLREKLLKCEDMTGDDYQILARFEEAKQIEVDTNEIAGSVLDIKTQIEEIQANFRGCDINSLLRDYTTLSKKQQSLLNQTNKVCTTLDHVIEKHYQDKLDDLMRFIAVHQEKLEWCKPEPGIDRYGIEAKLASVIDTKASLTNGEQKRRLLEISKPLADQVIPVDMKEKFDAGFNSTIVELEDVELQVDKTECLLRKSLILWKKYEEKNESLSAWLKESENIARNESSNLVDIEEIDEKLIEINNLSAETEDRDDEMASISQQAQELQKLNPDSKAKDYANALFNRLDKIKSFCASYVSQLEQLQQHQSVYSSSVVKMEAWLKISEEKLKTFENLSISGGKPTLAYQTKLQNLKEFVAEKKNGQKLLNEAVESGESLFSSITSDGRENIRQDLRKLRDTWEAHLERVNQLYKHVETIIMQWSSFDDNLNQANKWIDETELKVDAPFSYKKTLGDKKSQCQHYKLLLQDINSHETMIHGLREKMEFLTDEDISRTVDDLNERYESMLETSQEHILTSEKYVGNHETFFHHLENFRDWLNSQNNEIASCVDVSPDSNDVQDKMSMLETLESSIPHGQNLLDKCDEALTHTLDNTHPDGHDAIQEDFESYKSNWINYQEEITERRKVISEVMSQFYDCEETVQELRDWLRAIEVKVKDPSLKSTLEDKEAHIDKLRQLEDEISYKGREFNEALSQAQSLDSEGKHANNISQMMTRYQALKSVIKEMLNRYQHFVRDHRTFLDKYNESMEWITAVDQDLREHAAVVGDMKLLQMRRNKVEQLVELKSTQANKIESVLELGERLYVHTAPDGREILRQMLRELRDMWETWREAVTGAAITLDQCLHQFSDFSIAQEQLTKWLKDVEIAMQQHTELKGSLQEKTSQLQNHRLVHQEIQTHQNLVETVCVKAQTLVDQTQDRGLNVFIQSIKTLFQNILVKSKDLLDKLNSCVKDHALFNTLCKGFNEWLNTQKELLQLCADASGEKSDLVKKIETLKVWNIISSI